MAAFPVGIDLGTTYSCVAVWRNGKVETIVDEAGNRTIPSYVAFGETDRLIGEPAKAQAFLNPRNTIYDVKRLIGRNYSNPIVEEEAKNWSFPVWNNCGQPSIAVNFLKEERNFAPEEISAMLLQKLKQSAEAYLGATVTDAVLTVPAHFNHSQRQSTIDAATIAGLSILRIMNEPTAAALAYSINRKFEQENNILVYDLGGGTFDVTILTVSKSTLFEVKATAGDSHLGGQDFNNRLVNHFIEEIKRKHKKDVSGNPTAISRLRDAAETAKRILSSETVANIHIESLCDGFDFNSHLKRCCFEGLCLDLFTATIRPVERAIVDAGLKKEDLDEVILVGGSTRIPRVQKILKEYLGRSELNCLVNPDEAVAHGAAIQAAALAGRPEDKVKGFLLTDVTPLSLGIEIGGKVMNKVIGRNTPIPCVRNEMFTTYVDNQPIATIQVYEGEENLTKNNHLLGKFDLAGIPPAPQGYPQIDVTFQVDANGILNVSARDIRTGRNNKIQLKTGRSRLSNDELRRMIREAENFRQRDEKQGVRSIKQSGVKVHDDDIDQQTD